MLPHTLSSEDVACGPVASRVPFSVSFRPDEPSAVCFLFPDSQGARQIYTYSCTTPDDSPPTQLLNVTSSGRISYEEQLRRERMRLFSTGVTSYYWVKRDDRTALMIPINDQILVFQQGEVFTVYDGHLGAPIDPTWSPNGNYIAFVVSGDIYYISLPLELNSMETKPVLTRLTYIGEREGFSCGLADFLAQEEMDRYRGYWWSPDSKHIVFTVLDETRVPEFTIQHMGSEDPYASETHRYPFTGKMNPCVQLSVIRIDTPMSAISDATIIPLPHISPNGSIDVPLSGSQLYTAYSNCEDNYIARVGFWPDGGIMVQVTNRLQSTLALLHVDTTAPYTYRVVLTERTDVWVNLHELLYTFDFGWSPKWRDISNADNIMYFLWGSERSGFMRLYLYSYNPSTCSTELLNSCNGEDGALGGPGNFVTDSILHVDTAREIVYYSSNQHGPTEKHIYVAPLTSSNRGCQSIRITPSAGWHSGYIDPTGEVLVDIHSSISSPPVMSTIPLVAIDVWPEDASDYLSSIQWNWINRQRIILSNGRPSAVTPLSNSCLNVNTRRSERVLPALCMPEFYTIPSNSSSGDDHELHCCIYKPDVGLHGQGPYPCVVAVYGGPHVQRVTNMWVTRADMRAQRLAQHGIVVIKCDNRGSSRRGLRFEGAIKHDMGNLEISDQRRAVQHFVELGLVDKDKVGIYGWSYGGYMSAMALCKAPETFHCAVAGAPVTSWDGYDTHYTERYMGLPFMNPSGYASSSVMNHVEGLRGHLLLVHGSIDENVHFRHTARLISAIIAHRKRYDLMCFPRERHAPHDLAGLIYMEDRILKFLIESLNIARPQCSMDSHKHDIRLAAHL